MDTSNEQIFIFISYGNDPFTENVVKICDDLKKRNFKIWFDKERIQPGDNPHNKIFEAMQVLHGNPENRRFLLFITPYSVRIENNQEYGYCLNELQKASNDHVPIYPIVLEKADFPMDVTRKKYLDLTDCIPLEHHVHEYNKRLNSLVNALNGEEMDTYWKYNDWDYLKKFLTPYPFQFDQEIDQFSKHFFGRNWIIDPVMRWVESSSDSKVLLLTGELGIGKSALACCIIKSLNETKAFHFIDFKSPEKSNPERLILNLCYQLCRQIEEYKRIVIKLPLEDIKLNNKSGTQASLLYLFDVLILQPMSHRDIKDKYRIIIIIDGLDEIRRSENSYITDDFISALGYTINKLPQSLKFILTSRPENDILKILRSVKRMDLQRKSVENINDISQFLQKSLAEHVNNTEILERISNVILQKSEGMFLYVCYVVQEILSKEIAEANVDQLIDNLPIGIDDIYRRTFNRIFPEPGFYNVTLRKYLELTFVAKDSINLEDAGLLLNWDENQMEVFRQNTGWLFMNFNGVYKPFHNSLYEWLTNKEQAGDYFINTEKGHESLAKMGMSILKKPPSLRDISVGINSRLLDELPYHLIRLQKNQELEDAICDISFLVMMFNKDKYQCIAYFSHLENHDTLFERIKANVRKLESEISDVNDLANIYQSIGLLYFEIKEYIKSIYFLEKALPYGEEITDVLIKAKIYNDLAESYMNNSVAKEQIDENGFGHAKEYYIKAIKCLWKYQNKKFRNHPDMADYINNYGHLFFHKKEYIKSEALYLKAFKIRERCCKYPYDRLLGESKYNIGMARFEKGEEKDNKLTMGDGIRLIEESLELNRNANRYWDKEVAIYKYHLALRYITVSRIDEAIKLIEESFSIRLYLYGADHPDTKSSFSFWEAIMSKLFFLPGRYSYLDENLIDKALELRKERLPRYSKEIISIYIYKSAILLYKGKVDDAIRSMKHAERLSSVINLSSNEILDVVMTNINALLCTRNYNHAKQYLERIYSEYAKNMGVTHTQTLEYFHNLMQMYFGLPMSERRNAIDFIMVLVGIAQKLVEHLNKSQKCDVDIKIIRAISVTFNEIAFNKYLPEKDWANSEINFKKALDFMKICKEEVEIANMEVNLQLAYFLSGKTVNIQTVENAKEVLIRYKDVRMFKAALILRSLFEDNSSPKYNIELLLNLFFAVAIADNKADNLELDMMKKMVDPVMVDTFNAKIMTLYEGFAGNSDALVKHLVARAIELTKNNNYTVIEIKKILHHVIFVVLADLRILPIEIQIINSYANSFGITDKDINSLVCEFL